jgi:hypothetical protein
MGTGVLLLDAHELTFRRAPMLRGETIGNVFEFAPLRLRA